MVSSGVFGPAGDKLLQRDRHWDKEDRLPHTGPASRFESAKMLAGSGAPPPEEIPTEREYSFLLPPTIAWFSFLAGYLRQRTHRQWDASRMDV